MTLEQLLDNFRYAVVSEHCSQGNYGTEIRRKAAQEAIVSHVEGAMGDARRFGKIERYTLNDVVKYEAWDKVISKWTTYRGGRNESHTN